MKTIYFIRHAQSEANLKDILASRQDFPLTEKGRQEAIVIASELKNIAQLDRIFCSPLKRAQQTAQPIAEALSKLLSRAVRFEPDWIDGFDAEPGEVVVCENVRFQVGVPPHAVPCQEPVDRGVVGRQLDGMAVATHSWRPPGQARRRTGESCPAW